MLKRGSAESTAAHIARQRSCLREKGTARRDPATALERCSGGADKGRVLRTIHATHPGAGNALGRFDDGASSSREEPPERLRARPRQDDSDAAALIEAMRQRVAAGPEIYRPGEFWDGLIAANLEMLKTGESRSSSVRSRTTTTTGLSRLCVMARFSTRCGAGCKDRRSRRC